MNESKWISMYPIWRQKDINLNIRYDFKWYVFREKNTNVQMFAITYKHVIIVYAVKQVGKILDQYLYTYTCKINYMYMAWIPVSVC